jgi:hypothetical protein
VLTVTRHWAHLFETVEQLYSAGHYGAAVIVAQTACEVVMARAMTLAATAKQQPGNQDRRGHHRLQSYSADNRRVRQLYNALTDDDIAAQPFWQAYGKMLDLRHDAVHAGASVPQEAARTGIEAAKLLISHVERHNNLQG